MIRAATSTYRQDQATTQYWHAQMLGLDAELATKAVLTGQKEWRYFPSWSQFYEMYRYEKRKAEARLAGPVGEQRAELPEGGKRGVAAPEWVHVWYWARRKRTPPETRAFPQQEEYVDPASVMSAEDYLKLRDEWDAAGSPKSPNPLATSLRATR